jgi:LysM repeat protein
VQGSIRAVIVSASVAVLFVLSAAAMHAGPLAQGPVVHVVQRGETLTSIAARHSTTVAAIVQANGLRNTNFVWTGQRLRIPGTTSPAQNTAAPASSQQVHVVKRGETLTSVAAHYGVGVSALMSANGLSNPNFVYTGQRLVIPGSETSPATPAPAADSQQPAAVSQQPAESDGKRIVVSLSQQTLSAYENNQLVFSTLVSTGLARTPTPVGRFKIYAKYRAQTMVGPGYYLPSVPHVMYFAGGNAIHGTYWHNNFGHPMSHGCVNASREDAAWLYQWAGIGTVVIVQR